MRLHLEIPVYGLASTARYSDSETLYYKVWNMWLRVDEEYYWYFERDKNSEIVFEERSDLGFTYKGGNRGSVGS